jgi:hypothetical protein
LKKAILNGSCTRKIVPDRKRLFSRRFEVGGERSFFMVSPMRTARQKIVFTSTISPGRYEISALLLAESIRAFAGRLSKSPIWFYVTLNTDELSCATEDKLYALDVELIPFRVDHKAAKFFFMPEVVAAAEAEERAVGQADTQVWLGSNTLVLREPWDLVLPGGKNMGYRPVHHTLVGSRFDSPLDTFWSLIYERCGVPRDRVFPMKTHIDGNTLRPYFNAGLLAVRPERHFIKKWRDTFTDLYQRPEFEKFYANEMYRIFMHQAVLSAVALASFPCDELLELPPTYNYPVHLYHDDVTGRRPGSIEELVTVRHEKFYKDPVWEEKIPAGEPLKRWIAERLRR